MKKFIAALLAVTILTGVIIAVKNDFAPSTVPAVNVITESAVCTAKTTAKVTETVRTTVPGETETETETETITTTTIATTTTSTAIVPTSAVVSTSAAAADTTTEALRSVDFSSLKAKNSDIYAWLTVSGTRVDYPIVQNEWDDFFYLNHSGYDQSSSLAGAIYTEMQTAMDFSDAVTVIYGHSGYGTVMFDTLRYFEDESFFASYEYFTIYTPDKRLTYQIISAFKYSNRHILNTFDFSSSDTLSSFQKMLQNPDSPIKNVRTSLDTTLGSDSKIVILSTCYHGDSGAYRWLVAAVLVKTNSV